MQLPPPRAAVVLNHAVGGWPLHKGGGATFGSYGRPLCGSTAFVQLKCYTDGNVIGVYLQGSKSRASAAIGKLRVSFGGSNCGQLKKGICVPLYMPIDCMKKTELSSCPNPVTGYIFRW